MSDFIVGRLYGWPDFAEGGREVWVVHAGAPPFFMRVVHRPEGALPSGDLLDLRFPLETDPGFALGNLIFLTPQGGTPAEVASLVSGAIDAIHDAEVLHRLNVEGLPFDPVPADVYQEDLPAGFVIGVYYDAVGRRVDAVPWVVHVGLPPFVLKLSEMTDEAPDAGDVWASVEGGAVLSRLHWLTNVGCSADEVRHRATTGAEILREVARVDMPDL